MDCCGGWTQILGSEAFEPGTWWQVEKCKFYLCQAYLALSLGVISFEYQQDLWHQKTRVPGLLRGILCKILYLAILIQYQRVMNGWIDEQMDGHKMTVNTCMLAQLHTVKNILELHSFYCIALHASMICHNSVCSTSTCHIHILCQNGGMLNCFYHVMLC